jgi:hypothetical protein
MVHPGNARAVLAASCLLGGMPELCDHAYAVCRSSITPESIISWVDFVYQTPTHAAESGPDSGASTPKSPAPAIQPLPSVFGAYGARLHDDVFRFLISVLPGHLGVSASPAAASSPLETLKGRDALLNIFSRLPFEIFKAAIESPDLQIGEFSSLLFAAVIRTSRKHPSGHIGASESPALVPRVQYFGAPVLCSCCTPLTTDRT